MTIGARRPVPLVRRGRSRLYAGLDVFVFVAAIVGSFALGWHLRAESRSIEAARAALVRPAPSTTLPADAYYIPLDEAPE